MRDILSEILENQPIDPMVAARRGARPDLRKRFYTLAHVAEAANEAGGFQVLLDGKPIKTPKRRALAAPSRAIAEGIAQEWNAQENAIDAARMPRTRLANVTIDAVADSFQPVADEVTKYFGSDLLCYRASTPEGLVARQAQLWDPVLSWTRDDLGAHFVLVEGVIYADQPRPAIDAARAALPAAADDVKDIWRMAAIASITALTGSGLLALALAHGRIDADAAWTAAHLDEDWQMEFWGRDDAALDRRAFRHGEFMAAADVLRLTT
jgi:chaperone required for assembly of F1-ATPase